VEVASVDRIVADAMGYIVTMFFPAQPQPWALSEK
jgi:hypothetical protein